jgi:hypothetical protein
MFQNQQLKGLAMKPITFKEIAEAINAGKELQIQVTLWDRPKWEDLFFIGWGKLQDRSAHFETERGAPEFIDEAFLNLNRSRIRIKPKLETFYVYPILEDGHYRPSDLYRIEANALRDASNNPLACGEPVPINIETK